MADHGRLFTLADVERLAICMHVASDFREAPEVVAGALEFADRSQGGRLTFPAGEPLFVLRASDAAVQPEVFAAYSLQADVIGASIEYLHGVDLARREFARWQQVNADRVNVPTKRKATG